MKQPKKLTRSQKEFLSKKGLNHVNWMYSHSEDGKFVFVNKKSKKTRSF